MSRILSTRAFTLWMFFFLTAGLLAIGGVYLIFNPNYLQGDSPFTLSPLSKDPVSLSLNLTSPENNQLVFDPKIKVEGKTSPKATVVMSAENLDQALEADGGGDFSTTLTLIPGVNEITILTLDEQGNTKTEERTVYYSKEKI